MSLNGKWRAVEINDASAFLEYVSATEEYKQQVAQLRQAVKSHPDLYIEELEINKAAGTIKRHGLINGEQLKDSADTKLGVEFDGFVADGRPAKVKYTLESDTKLVLHEKAYGLYIQCTFEVSGDSLTATAVPVGHDSAFVVKLQRV